jgi:hypothetical protein
MGIKKRTIGVMIVGDIHIGLGRAMAEVIASTHMNDTIIIVGSGGDIVDKKEEVNNQFGNPPMKIENLRCFEPTQEVDLKHMEFSNPWPSPKGRKGKKRW